MIIDKNEYDRNRYRAKRAQGECYKCRRPAMENKCYCEVCVQKKRSIYALRISNGFCGACGLRKIGERFNVCLTCRKARVEKYQQKRSSAAA